MRYLLAALAFALIVLADSASVAAGSSITGFQTPSRNIVCGAFVFSSQPATLRCDISSGLKPKPARPKNCHFDYGGTLKLGATGRTTIGCISDAVLPNPAKAPVLAFGKTIKAGPFKCTSAKAGLTCKNRSGHGFFLARGRWSTF
jgi:hypothetical protein